MRNTISDDLADGHGLTRKKADALVESFADLLLAELRDAGEVNLKGFGTFKLKDTPARMGRNPKTGEPAQIKASKRIKFTPSKVAREYLGFGR